MAHIFQINTSNGGVPKLPRQTAQLTSLGLEGDRQIHLNAHGGPERALCIFSLERILALQTEGHPVYPGACGETLDLTGTDWEAFQPGARFRLGETVEIEITRFTVPCNALTPYFIDGDYSRISPTLHPGWARVYARALAGGLLRVGDPVIKI